MPRPYRCRRIGCRPRSLFFSPPDSPDINIDGIILKMDEFEAVRLADLEGMYQEKAAKKMNISRQTFGNIIESARKKIADALVNAKTIKIEGGEYKIMEKHFTCYDCKHEWSLPYGAGRPNECPKCQSKNIHRATADFAFGRGMGRGCGWGHGAGRGLGRGICRRTI